MDGLERPLEGVRVVTFEQALAMPYGSWILAEMGADVIKLERPGRGDVIRGWDQAVRGLSTGFVWVNAGKRDLAVDLGRPEGREVARRLALGADVFLENFAPGVAARQGLAYSELEAENPRLVYCSLSGYGQSGPYAARKAYDLLVQGESGLILTTGYEEAPAKIGLAITDLLAGTHAALAVVMALRQRERTGRGSYLDVSMFDSILAWLGYYPQHYWASGVEPPRTGMRHQYLVPYGPYLAADRRYVNVVVANEDDWRRFCENVVGRPEWLQDERFQGVAVRTAHRGQLEPLIDAVMAAEPAQVWLERLEAAGLAYGEVRGIAEVLDHPQLAARDMAVTATSPVGELPLIRFPLAPAGAPRHVPGLGEHTDQILLEAGYSPEEIAQLRHQGVVA
jgi:itaconate CoA-transferase